MAPSARAVLAGVLGIWLASPAAAQTSPSPEPVLTFQWESAAPRSEVAQVVTQALTEGLKLIAGLCLPLVVIFALLLGLDCLLGKLDTDRVVAFFVGAIMIFGAQALAGIFGLLLSAGTAS